MLAATAAAVVVVASDTFLQRSLQRTRGAENYLNAEFLKARQRTAAHAAGNEHFRPHQPQEPGQLHFDGAAPVHQHPVPDFGVLQERRCISAEWPVREDLIQHGRHDQIDTFLNTGLRSQRANIVRDELAPAQARHGMALATLEPALKNLGYKEQEVKEIMDYILAHDGIEGAPHLKEKDIAVFDCAVNAPGGKRAIHYSGHIRMIAAAQPFISGAISKTVNLPESATVEDIMNTYIDAWKMGLKAIAIYRDKSKGAQPLNTSKAKPSSESAVGAKEAAPSEVERKKLPSNVKSLRHKFSIAGHEGYLTYSMYENRDLAEIFITMSKQGSTLAGLLDAFAISVSIALQHGVPLKTLARKFVYGRFEPAGFTENSAIFTLPGKRLFFWVFIEKLLDGGPHPG